MVNQTSFKSEEHLSMATLLECGNIEFYAAWESFITTNG